RGRPSGLCEGARRGQGEEGCEGKGFKKSFHLSGLFKVVGGIRSYEKERTTNRRSLPSRALLTPSRGRTHSLKLLSFAASGDLSPCSALISPCAPALSSSARYARPRLK